MPSEQAKLRQPRLKGPGTPPAEWGQGAVERQERGGASGWPRFESFFFSFFQRQADSAVCHSGRGRECRVSGRPFSFAIELINSLYYFTQINTPAVIRGRREQNWFQPICERNKCPFIKSIHFAGLGRIPFGSGIPEEQRTLGLEGTLEVLYSNPCPPSPLKTGVLMSS